MCVCVCVGADVARRGQCALVVIDTSSCELPHSTVDVPSPHSLLSSATPGIPLVCWVRASCIQDSFRGIAQVDYLFVDSNVNDAFAPQDQPSHNMCSEMTPLAACARGRLAH